MSLYPLNSLDKNKVFLLIINVNIYFSYKIRRKPKISKGYTGSTFYSAISDYRRTYNVEPFRHFEARLSFGVVSKQHDGSPTVERLADRSRTGSD